MIHNALSNKHNYTKTGQFTQIFPECTSPLTLSSVIFVLQKIIGDIVKSYKPKFGGIFPSVLAVSHYRIMFDVYNVIVLIVYIMQI